jgi:murein DD-endopeptidase MepM/ murein hydrolase activator NlpD
MPDITQNVYRRPIDSKLILRETYRDSPAHVGALYYAVDFIVPKNTPVRAALGGKIVHIKRDGTKGGDTQDFEQFGNFIEIEHDNGEYSEYEHLKPGGVIVKKDQIVTKGHIIGYSGATGWLGGLGPHLHFQVHKYTRFVSITDYELQTLQIRWE